MGSRPRVLMASYFDWGSPLHLGSHNLATAFADAGWEVAYVSTALSPVQAFRDWGDFRSKSRRFAIGGRWQSEHLWSYLPFSLVTPHNQPVLRSRLVHRSWQRLSVPNVVRKVRSQGFGEVDLLYVDTPLQAFWLERIAHRASLVRITDRNTGYVGSAPELEKMERELVQSVDLAAHTARGLGDDLRARGAKRVLYLPNGVNFSHFADADRRAPPEYAKVTRPIAVYVGSLDEWFDYDAVNAATRALPHVSFVIIGPSRHAANRLVLRPNIQLMGPRPFHELPTYLHNADVGLLPRNVRTRGELVHAMHPLKLYEYMACGLPVVATRTEELESMESPATLCADTDAFVDAIRTTLNEPSDPAPRLAFARQADWSARLTTLLDGLPELSP